MGEKLSEAALLKLLGTRTPLPGGSGQVTPQMAVPNPLTPPAAASAPYGVGALPANPVMNPGAITRSQLQQAEQGMKKGGKVGKTRRYDVGGPVTAMPSNGPAQGQVAPQQIPNQMAGQMAGPVTAMPSNGPAQGQVAPGPSGPAPLQGSSGTTTNNLQMHQPVRPMPGQGPRVMAMKKGGSVKVEKKASGGAVRGTGCAIKGIKKWTVR